jgi:hypothetical protein
MFKFEYLGKEVFYQRGYVALSSAEAYMKFLVRESERARSDGKS